MTLKEQEHHVERLFSEMKDILLKKGNDYANADRLSNFKLAGQICGMKPEMNCLNLIATKVARLGVLLNSDKDPNNESTLDSVIDLANYSVLLSMLLSEKYVSICNEDEFTVNIPPYPKTATIKGIVNTFSSTKS